MKSDKTTDNSDICEINCIHPENVDKVIGNFPESEKVSRMAETFKILSDATRLKIVLAIMETELCVCDISEIVEISQSAASHQLRVLRSARLAKFRKEGKQVFYSIDDEHVSQIIKQALNHIQHVPNN